MLGTKTLHKLNFLVRKMQLTLNSNHIKMFGSTEGHLGAKYVKNSNEWNLGQIDWKRIYNHETNNKASQRGEYPAIVLELCVV